MRIPSRFRLSFFVLVVAVLLAAVGVAAARLGGAADAMRARFNLVRLGMSQAEVNALMGADGVPLLKAEDPAPAQGPWLWSGEGGRVVVWFEDGAVTARDFTPSPPEPFSRKVWKWIGRR